jgi:hypothetical protein
MAVKEYYHDLDLVKVGQLVNARLQNVTDAEMSTLASTLGAANKGLVVYNTTQEQQFNWNGTSFDAIQIDISGDVIFKGVVDASVSITSQTQDISGYQYVVGTAGNIPVTLTFDTRTVDVVGDTNADGTVTVEVGDVLLFADTGTPGADVSKTQSTRADKLYVLQRNDEQATETTLGNIRLATQAEVNTGTVTDEAVTPATLQGKLVGQAYTKQFFGTFNLSAATPLTVNHNLNLVDRNAFQVNVMLNNSQVSVDVDSVNANSLTLTSLIALTNAKVTVTGASAS